MSRLQLKPGLRQVWRGPDVVQIGLDRRYGTIIQGVTDSDRRLLRGLLTGVDPGDVTGDSTTGERARAMVRLLSETDTLVQVGPGRGALAVPGPERARLTPDAHIWSIVHGGSGDGWELLAGRAGRTVHILGAGRTATVLATVLVAAGVGAVEVCDQSLVTEADVVPGGPTPADIGSSARAAAATAARRVTATRPPSRGGGRPDLTVLLDHGVADAGRAQPLVAADQVHLSVVVGEASVVVGPLVVPGRGPCLRCLDLHRADRDRQWPRILAQLLPPPPPDRPAEVRRMPEESASAVMAGASTALQVLAHLDGQAEAASHGATLELELPDGLISRRTWPTHPSCGCRWPPAPVRSGRPGDASEPVDDEQCKNFEIRHGYGARSGSPPATMQR